MKQIEKLEKGQFADVVTFRGKDDEPRVQTNIQKYSDDNSDFEWGYNGTGPTIFAINILLHFTRGDEPFARHCCHEFRDKFIVKVPKQGGTIPQADILAYIKEKQAALENDERFKSYLKNFKSLMGHEPMKRW